MATRRLDSDAGDSRTRTCVGRQ